MFGSIYIRMTFYKNHKYMKKKNKKKLKLKSLKDRINRRTKVVYDIETFPEQIIMFNPEIAELFKEIGQQVLTNIIEKQLSKIIICDDSDVNKFRLKLRELCKLHDIPDICCQSVYGNGDLIHQNQSSDIPKQIKDIK